jgi:hypothetical protein
MKKRFKIFFYYVFKKNVFKMAVSINLIHTKKVDMLKKAITMIHNNEKRSVRDMVHPAQMELNVCRYLNVKPNETGRELARYLNQPWAKLNLDLLARKIDLKNGHNVS